MRFFRRVARQPEKAPNATSTVASVADVAVTPPATSTATLPKAPTPVGDQKVTLFQSELFKALAPVRMGLAHGEKTGVYSWGHESHAHGVNFRGKNAFVTIGIVSVSPCSSMLGDRLRKLHLGSGLAILAFCIGVGRVVAIFLESKVP